MRRKRTNEKILLDVFKALEDIDETKLDTGRKVLLEEAIYKLDQILGEDIRDAEPELYDAEEDEDNGVPA